MTRARGRSSACSPARRTSARACCCPVYHRLPAADEFDSLEFLRVEVATDDGLAQAVCEEAFVAKSCPTPTFCFYSQCSELKLWRYEGCDVAELTRRLKKLAEADANGEDLERLEPDE